MDGPSSVGPSLNANKTVRNASDRTRHSTSSTPAVSSRSLCHVPRTNLEKRLHTDYAQRIVRVLRHADKSSYHPVGERYSAVRYFG